MRLEIELWFKQAMADLRAAKSLLASKDFHASIFFIHQAVEKLLKAVYIAKMKSSNLKTHNILQLGRELRLKPRLLTFLAKLSPEYILSRYPDATYGVPAERYTEEIVREYLGYAEEVVKWAESEIK